MKHSDLTIQTWKTLEFNHKKIGLNHPKWCLDMILS